MRVAPHQLARAVAASLLLVPAPAGAGPLAEPPAAAALDQAKALFHEGVALLDAGDVEHALDRFLRSRVLVPSGRNTANAAICLDRLGRFVEALELFEEVHARHLTDLGEAHRATIAPAIQALQRRVGTIEVSANVEGASVVIDGRARGKLPLSAPIRVLAGERDVRLLKDGYEAHQVTLDVPPGGRSTIDAQLRMFARRGQLRVEDPGGEASEVFVDGARVGESPWEGTLAPRRYLIWTQKGETGSAPASVIVIEGQVALIRARSGPLGSPARIEAEPRTAEVAVDDVVVGAGAWAGRLPVGRHEVRVAEYGYRTRSEQLDVPGVGAPLRLLIRLEIEPGHPRWPRPVTGGFWVTALGGFAAAPTLSSSASKPCPDACYKTPFADGGFAAVRGGYRLPMGISFDLEAGYFALRSALVHFEYQMFMSPADGNMYPIRYDLFDHLYLRGPFLGAGASYRRDLGRRAGLVLRFLTGVLFASSGDDVTSASANATAADRSWQPSKAETWERANVHVHGQKYASSTPLLLWPEIGIDVALGPLRVGATMGAAIFAPAGPILAKRLLEVLDKPDTPDTTHPGNVRNATDRNTDHALRTYGRVVAVTPQLFVEHTF